MSEARGHERWDDELAAYALGSLERSEADAMERHMARCERCQERLRWLEPAVDVLPASVPQLEPPPALRERLVRTVREEAKAEAAVPTRPRRRPSWLAAPRPAIALGTMAAVAAGVVGYALNSGDESSTVPVQARAGAAELERDGDAGTLQVSDMPRLRGRDVYEVWLLRGRTPRPSGVFVLDDGRDATVAIPSGLDSTSRVMVTREPRGGSDRPTTKPLLRASL